MESLFHPLTDYQLFNDVHFFELPDEDPEADRHTKGDFDAIAADGGEEMEEKNGGTNKVAPAADGE